MRQFGASGVTGLNFYSLFVAVVGEARADGFANSDIEASVPVLAVVFLGVVGGRHQCRPATDEELQRTDPESPIKEPTGFMFARQGFCEFLAEVFGV